VDPRSGGAEAATEAPPWSMEGARVRLDLAPPGPEADAIYEVLDDAAAARAPAAGLKGVVILAAGDDVPARDVLPWGARLEPLAGEVAALAAHAFADLDPQAVERARAHGGGVIVAGQRFGRDAAREEAALALAALGIGAVIARSLDPAFRTRLARAGVWPLRFATPRDAARVAQGDEIELPELPEPDEMPGTLTVRNLTRGVRFAVTHDLDRREVTTVRAGGALAFALERMASGGER
jgi:aconitate hydratase